MANFFWTHNRAINVDLIRHVTRTDGSVIIHFAPDDAVELTGRQATEFWEVITHLKSEVFEITDKKIRDAKSMDTWKHLS